MKRLLIIYLLSLTTTFSFGQIKKTILKHTAIQPRWVIECDNETEENCRMTVYYRSGKLKAKLKVIYHDKRNAFRPNGDGIVYFEDGSVFQNYNHTTGELLTYYPSGELKAKMITPITGDKELKYTYFKNGQLWEEEDSKREIGRQNLQFGHSSQNDYFYDNHGYSYHFYKTYHSNGNVASHTFIDENAPHLKYVYQYFHPNGELDKSAIYDKVSGRMMKNGLRYTYHPNGQMSMKTPYVNDKLTGERLMWSKNGQLIEKGNYKDGSRHGKYEAWWENGAPKEISYHEGYYKNGSVFRWHHDGRILEQGSYYKGKAVGITTSWDTLGKVSYENIGSIEKQYGGYHYGRYVRENTIQVKGKGIVLSNGLRDGTWKFYFHQKGTNKTKESMSGLAAVVTYQNGLLHGKIKVNHPNGTTAVKANYTNGWLDGEYISFLETGDAITKGNFRQHKKEGLWTRNHHKSNKVYNIQFYVNNSNTETYKEWDKDGFLKKDRVDNKRLKQIEYYEYHKGGTFNKSVKPYGWENRHYYYYHANGKLKEARELINDNPYHYIQTKYYPNGKKEHTSAIIDNKRDGIFWAWYEDGKLKSQIPFENGKRQGISYSWSEDGVVSETLFTNGVQIIQNTLDEKLLQCACNRSPEETSNNYMTPLYDYVPLEKATQRTKYYTIPEKSYRRLYNRDARQYDNNISGRLAIFNDFYVEVNNGLTLNFTACRRGVNRAHLDINGQYSPKQNSVDVTIRDFDLSIEFPQTLLRLYDVENQQLLETSIKKYQKSSVRYEVDAFRYRDNGTTPEIILQSIGEPCFQISEIGSSGVLLDGRYPTMDFSPTAFPNELTNLFQKAYKKNYLATDGNYYHLAPSRKYLNEFIGVVFMDAMLYIPYENNTIAAPAKNIFINGTEIYGTVSIPMNGIDRKAFLYYFASKGFDILNYEKEDERVLHIFFRYVG